MKIENLALNILHSDKLPAEEIIKHIASSIDEDIEPAQEYKELYERAYGHKLSNDIITEWVMDMAVTDNSERETGQKWTMEQTTEVGNKINVDWNKISKCDFYCVMNMMYSDNYKTAKSFNLQDDPMFFARLAKDWLCDVDTDSSTKLYNYYFSVVI